MTCVRVIGGACAMLALGACDPISLTALGVGGAAGVHHTLSGIAYRTFAVPLPNVRSAARSALGRMEIKVVGTEKTASGERILARATDRDIEIELEALTPKTTRMRSIARNGVLMDAATATEIIIQTERLLGST